MFLRNIKKNDILVRALYPGDHFGEISMIYKCRRTGTVISDNYNTMATLKED